MGAAGLISIVVPCYNYGRFIEETLRSVQRQDYPHWECIVVDDGSTDDSAERVRPFLADHRMRYHFQENRGLSAARNAGLKLSRGEFIQFLDADDHLSPDKLLRHVEFFAKSPHVDVSYSDYRYFPSDSPDQYFPSLELRHDSAMPRVSGQGMQLLAGLLNANIMPVNAAMVRRSLVDRIGAFDEGLRYLEDWDFWLRAAFSGSEIRYLGDGQGYANIRVHKTSMSGSKRPMLEGELALRKKVAREFIDGVGAIESKRILELNKRYWIRSLVWLMRECELERSRMLQFLRTEPPLIFLKACLRALKKPKARAGIVQ